MATATSSDDRINRDIVAQYFTGAYVGLLRNYQRLRMFVAIARLVVGAAGLALVAWTWHDLWQQTGQLMVWPIPQTVVATPLGIGAILVFAAAIGRLWSYGWELPAAFVAALMIAEVALFNFADRRIMISAITVALAAIVAGIYSRVRRRRAPLDLPQLEPKLDAWTDQLIERFIAQNVVPEPSLTPAACRHVLKTFPKLERSSGAPRVLGRLGTDGRPRVSPIGVAAFVFGDRTVTAIEGAIDLGNEQVLYRRAHEFRYQDIDSMVWSSDAVEMTQASGTTVAPPRRRPGMGAADAGLRHRDTLEIRLKNGRPVSLVFADSALLPDARGKSVESLDHVRALWSDLMRHPSRG